MIFPPECSVNCNSHTSGINISSKLVFCHIYIYYPIHCSHTQWCCIIDGWQINYFLIPFLYEYDDGYQVKYVFYMRHLCQYIVNLTDPRHTSTYIALAVLLYIHTCFWRTHNIYSTLLLLLWEKYRLLG